MIQERIFKNSGGTTNDVIRLMKREARKSANYPYIQHISERIKNSPFPLERTFYFAYQAAKFERDPDNWQRIRGGNATLAIGRANCVDYSILISAILINLNIPHAFRFYAQDAESGYNHVFIVAYPVNVRTINGDGGKFYTLDAILGQPESMTEQWFPYSVNGWFNRSIPEYYRVLDVQII